MKVLMTLVLVLLLAGCAAGQRGAGQTSAEEETTANATEETTVQEGAGGRIRPPDGTLSYGGQKVKGSLGSYCWSRGSAGLCADKAGASVPPRNQTLTVPSGSEVVFRIGGESSPDTVNASASSLDKVMATASPLAETSASTASAEPKPTHQLKAHGSGAEKTITVDLPPGEYIVSIYALTPQGDAGYDFRVMVK